MREKKKPTRKSSQSRRRSLVSSRSAASRRSNSTSRARGSKASGRSRKVAARSSGGPASTGRRSSPTRSARSGEQGQAKAPRTRASRSSSSSSVTTNHQEIRRWAEERGGVPAMVADTGSEDEPSIVRIDFPGGAEDSLQSISWDEFLKKFDEKNLEFVYQDSTATGKLSRFNKFVDRGSTRSRSGSRTRTAGE